MLNRDKQRGDTLIEVLFAITVFSFVVVTALAIMSQGTAASQRSLEITLVRQQIDAQAETLRFMHDSYVQAYQSGASISGAALQSASGVSEAAKEWSRMLDIIRTRPSGPLSAVNECPSAPPAGSFVVDPVNVRVIGVANNVTLPGDNFAQLEYAANGTTFNRTNGLWIEAARSATNLGDAMNQSNVGYIDFNILACWGSIGANQASTQGTTVRLYEPRG